VWRGGGLGRAGGVVFDHIRIDVHVHIDVHVYDHVHVHVHDHDRGQWEHGVRGGERI
jgi:hypothetical protein